MAKVPFGRKAPQVSQAETSAASAGTTVVNVQDLLGAALDWAVMKCEYPTNESVSFFQKLRNEDVLYDGSLTQTRRGRFRYSERWDQGGPIIVRERINIQFCRDLRDMDCSGLIDRDTDLGENARHGEVSDAETTSFVFPRVQAASSLSGPGPGL